MQYVMNTWRILGPAPMIRNPVHPLTPHGVLPQSLSVRARKISHAKEDSKAGRGDVSSQWIVNMWALMWGSHKPTPGASVWQDMVRCCKSTDSLNARFFDAGTF